MEKIYEAAVRSKMSYLEPSEIPFETEFISSPEDAQVYVWKIDDTIYVTFRGTSSIKDVIKDLNIKRTRICGKIKVHKGFYTQFKSVQIKLTKLLMKMTTDVKRIVFSGHSLGGALAQIAAAYYGDVFEELFIACYTFGSPRVGNSHFVEWFTKSVDDHVRIAHDRDPIPMIPSMFYWVHTENDVPWYKRLPMLFNSDINEHSCDEYIHRVNLLSKNDL